MCSKKKDKWLSWVKQSLLINHKMAHKTFNNGKKWELLSGDDAKKRIDDGLDLYAVDFHEELVEKAEVYERRHDFKFYAIPKE